MQYPVRLQSMLTFDQRIDTLDALVRDFARVEEMKTGTIFAVSEHKPDLFAQLENAEEALRLSFEFCLGPPPKETLKQVLASPATTQLCPDIAARVQRAACHILLEVWHEEPDEGDVPSTEGDAGVQAGAARAEPQSERSQFHRRLELLTLMSRIPFDHTPPSAVHWAQSNRLFAGADFDAAAAQPIPGPLHIHPFIFGPKRQALDPEPATRGLRSFGAVHWIGGEVVVEPAEQDWRDSYSGILAFIAAKAGLSEANGAEAWADGEVFEPAGQAQRYRVKTRENEDDKNAALFELVPLDPAPQPKADNSSAPGPAIISAPAAKANHTATRMLQPRSKPVFGRKFV